MRKAVEDYNMIKQGDKIAIGLQVERIVLHCYIV